MRRLPRFRAPLIAAGLALAAVCLVTAAGTTVVAQSVAGTSGQAAVQGTGLYPERMGLPASFESDLPAAGGREVSMTLVGRGLRVRKEWKG